MEAWLAHEYLSSEGLLRPIPRSNKVDHEHIMCGNIHECSEHQKSKAAARPRAGETSRSPIGFRRGFLMQHMLVFAFMMNMIYRMHGGAAWDAHGRVTGHWRALGLRKTLLSTKTSHGATGRPASDSP